MKPLFDKVMIAVEKKATVTSSGIHLAIEKEEKLEKATVLAVGEDCVKLKAGDIILFKSYSIDTIELEGTEYSFIKEEEAFALCTTTTIA